jgi:CRISPR-associated protein Cas1
MFFVHTPTQACALAQSLIHAKLSNQLSVLQATGWSSAPSACTQIAQARQALVQAPDVATVRGYEGSAAAAYFGAWRKALDPAWGFHGRMFYPPPDPINALLSFGYTLLLHDVLVAVQQTGLDPYLGTFHVPEPGRPALALDLMEEFRPLVVDYLVLQIVRDMHLSLDQFERPHHDTHAVYVGTKGRSQLVDWYEAAMRQKVVAPSGDTTAMRRVLLGQSQAIARVLRGEQAQYVGYVP